MGYREESGAVSSSSRTDDTRKLGENGLVM